MISVHNRLICPVCGIEFRRRNKTQKYCSKKCRMETEPYHLAMIPMIKNCKICGNDFTTVNKYKMYCSDKCYSISNKNKVAEYHKTQIPAYIKMRFQVLQRDNFHCQYCGRGVEHGVILQIDHVTPQAKNGQDKIENYLTACQDCNVGKSDVLLILNEHQKAQLSKSIPSDAHSDGIPATTDGV